MAEDMLAENCFGISGENCEKTPYRYGKVIIAQGERFCKYPDGKEIAPYVDGVGSCVVKYEAEDLAKKMQRAGEIKESCIPLAYSWVLPMLPKTFPMCLMHREIRKCIPLFSPEPLW